MDAKQARKILAEGETQDVEFKESFPGTEETAKLICGFANVDGGIIAIGVKNNGRVAGITGNADELQKKMAVISQNIKTPPILKMKVLEIDGKKVLFVIVPKASDSNFHTYDGAIYVRIGSTTQRLQDAPAMLDYLRNRSILCFDEQVSEAKLGDVDENKVGRFLKLQSRDDYLLTHSVKDFLLNLKLAKDNGELKIKNAAVLFFAKNTQHFVPQAEIKLVKFSGVEPVDILTHKLAQGDVVDQIETALEFLKQNLPKQFKLLPSSPRSEDIYEYPLFVLREAIINAVAHRDYFSKAGVQINIYDDRLEMINPGSLPAGLPQEKFGRFSVPRNPNVYKLLRDLRYVEGYGTGIPRMRNEMRKAGLKDPIFEFSGNFFSVTFMNAKSTLKPIEGYNDLSERQKRVLAYLRQNQAIKSETCATLNNVSLQTAINDIRELIRFGFIKRIGRFRGAYYILNEEKFK